MIDNKIIELVFNDGRREEVTRNVTLIGRGNKADIRINDPKLSRLHCQITVDSNEGIVTIIDGDALSNKPSSYGTFVNGTRLLVNEGIELEHNTLISLGTGISFRIFITERREKSDELNPSTIT